MGETVVVRQYRIRGRVQGVGFRAFVWRHAREIGMTGWVRNRHDGTVEVLAAGSEELHRQLDARLHDGPFLSRVDAVDAHEATADAVTGDSFEIARDA